LLNQKVRLLFKYCDLFIRFKMFTVLKPGSWASW